MSNVLNNPVLASLAAKGPALSAPDLALLQRELLELPSDMQREDAFEMLQYGSLDDCSVGALITDVRQYRDELLSSGLEDFSGHVGTDAGAQLLSPQQFRLSAVRTSRRDDVVIYVGSAFRNDVEALLSNPGVQKYLTGTSSMLDRSLALAFAVIDNSARGLKLSSEGRRVQIARELLARIDHELRGADTRLEFAGVSFGAGAHRYSGIKSYDALVAFVKMAGMMPMASRALDIRDGRDKALFAFSGQGANYLAELKTATSHTELPVQRMTTAVMNLARPIFRRFNIDLDDLLALSASADKELMETYLTISGVRTSLPVIALMQAIRVLEMEIYGYDFEDRDFVEVVGQSGGQPAACFAAFQFEGPDFVKPEVPGAFGFRSRESLEKFFVYMLEEGILMQKSNPLRYDASAKFTSLSKAIKSVRQQETQAQKKVDEEAQAKGKPSTKIHVKPTDAIIAEYFAKYQITNVLVGGIEYNRDTPVASPLGRIVSAINAKFGSAHSRVFVSNISTLKTGTPSKDFTILIAGKGAALQEFIRMLYTLDASAYDGQIQSDVAALKSNENFIQPGTSTSISFAPHDPVDLQAPMEEHDAMTHRRGIILSAPRTGVIHNWTGELQAADIDHNPWLSRQQFVEQVDMDRVFSSALSRGVTTINVLGPGMALDMAMLPAILAGKPIDVAGIAGSADEADVLKVSGYDRLTTSNPTHARKRASVESVETSKTAVDALKGFIGITVEEQTAGLSVQLDRQLSEAEFEELVALFKSLDADGDVFKLLSAEKIHVNGADVSNYLSKLMINKKGARYEFEINEGRVRKLTLWENGGLSKVVSLLDDVVSVRRYHVKRSIPQTPIYEEFKLNAAGMYFLSNAAEMRKSSRVAYATVDWNLNTDGIRADQVFTSRQTVSANSMVRFAAQAMQSPQEIYTNPQRPDFQAHPHYLIELMWDAMISPAFVEEFDLDMTRVIDEGKSIRPGVAIKPGEVQVEAQIVRVEDFSMGRRVVVRAVAYQLNADGSKGDVVGEVVSSLVSRIPVSLEEGQPVKPIYLNPDLSDNINFLENKFVHVNPRKELAKGEVDPLLVADGTLEIPETLADSYYPDDQRLHEGQSDGQMSGGSVSNAIIKGQPVEAYSGRIMQGLATLAYVNEQIIFQLRRDRLARKFIGIDNLKYRGFVAPGQKLGYTVVQKATAQGTRVFSVQVCPVKPGKDGSESLGRPVMEYDLLMQGRKQGIIVTGQGSQYAGAGDHIANHEDAELKDVLALLQSWIPKKADGTSQFDLMTELNAATQDTSRAQPMIICYGVVKALYLLFRGGIADDAVFGGHSLGQWGAIFLALMQEKMRQFQSAGRPLGSKVDFLRSIQDLMQPIIIGVCQRGAAMKATDPEGMIAVTWAWKKGMAPLTSEDIISLQEIVNVLSPGMVIESANENSPGQFVLGGDLAAIEIVTPILQSKGFRVSRLPVDDAFHTSKKARAVVEFGSWTRQEGNPFPDLSPETVLYMDIEGRPLWELVAERGGLAKDVMCEIMTRQIGANVRWQQTQGRMIADGVEDFIEIGMGQILSGFVEAYMEWSGTKEGRQVLFPNPFKNPDDVEFLLFDRIRTVSHYQRPSVVIPQIKEAAPATVQASAPQPAVAETPQVAAVPSAPSVVPVSASQLSGVVSQFMSARAVNDTSDVNALAGELANSVAALGAGVRPAVEMRLGELLAKQSSSSTVTASTPVAASSGATLVDRVIAAVKNFNAKVASKNISATTKFDDVGLSSDTWGDMLESVGAELGATNVPPPDNLTDAAQTPQKIANYLSKHSPNVANAAPAAAPVAAVAAGSGLSVQEKIELAALQLALSRIPAAVMPAMPMAVAPSVVPVSASQLSGVVSQFMSARAVNDTSDVNALAVELANSVAALGAGVRPAVEMRLGELLAKQSSSSSVTASAPAAASSGATLVDRVIAAVKNFNTKVASKNITATTKFDDVGLSSDTWGDMLEAVGSELGATNVPPPDNLTDAAQTPQKIANYLSKHSPNVANAAPAAAPVAATAAGPGLSIQEKIELAALQLALSRIPAAVMPAQPMAAVPSVVPVSVAQLSGVVSQFMSARAVNDASEVNALAGELANSVAALGAGVRPAVEMRLGELLAKRSASSTVTASEPVAASSSASLVDRVIAAVKNFNTKVASKNITATTKFDDVGLSSDTWGDMLEVVGAELGATNVPPPDNLTDAAQTPQKIANYLGKHSPNVANAAPAAAPVATVADGTGLSIHEKIELAALERARSLIPAVAAAPSMATVASSMSSAETEALRATVRDLQQRLEAVEGKLQQTRSEQGGGHSTELAIANARIEALASERDRLKQMLLYVERGTSNALNGDLKKHPRARMSFVLDLMQPHYPPQPVLDDSGNPVLDDNTKLPRVRFTVPENEVFHFSKVEQNAGRENLIRFYADVRMGRLPEHEYDLNALLVHRANQLDEVSLKWLKGMIQTESDAGEVERVEVLQRLYDLASDNIQTDSIATRGSVTIRKVDHVPEYGNPKKSAPRVSPAGTQAHWEEMRPLADPKAADDVDWLMDQGIDMRSVPVLMQQAGTLSSPLLMKFLQSGAPCTLTDFGGRADSQPNGQSTNDYIAGIYGEASRGATLDVITHLQPGNPHDHEALINYYKDRCDPLYAQIEALENEGKTENQSRIDELRAQIIAILPQVYVNGAAYADYGPTQNKGDPLSVLSVLSLSSEFIALNLAYLHYSYKTDKQLVFLNYYSPNTSEDLAAQMDAVVSAMQRTHLPQARQLLEENIQKTAGEILGRILLLGEEDSQRAEKLSDLVSALREHGAVNESNLAELAVKLGAKGFAADRIAQAVEEITAVIHGTELAMEGMLEILKRPGLSDEQRRMGLFSILVGSGAYPGTKSYLKAGMVAGKASAAGWRTRDKRPSLVEVSKKTGWGKSNGDGVSIMSANDWYTMRLEEMADENGFKLLTLCGDQLATDHFSGVAAVIAGRRKNSHEAYDTTYGFGTAAEKGLLGKIMTDAAVEEGKKHKDAGKAWKEAQSAKKEDPRRRPNDSSLVNPSRPHLVVRGKTSGPFKVKETDLVLNDDDVVITGYGAVSGLAPDAEGTYFGLIGKPDYFNLARFAGIGVSDWDYAKMAESVGISRETVDNRYAGDFQRAFEAFLHENSGIQINGDIVRFRALKPVIYETDHVEALDAANQDEIKSYRDAGYEFVTLADGSIYAVGRAGRTYYRWTLDQMQITIAGLLPGHNLLRWVEKRIRGRTEKVQVRGTNFEVFGADNDYDVANEGHSARMAKMMMGQLLMSQGGKSPFDRQRYYSPEQRAIAMAEGLAEMDPLIEMIRNPVVGEATKKSAMAGSLSDMPAGALATEVWDAQYAARCVVAACSSANFNANNARSDLILLQRSAFERYYIATKRLAKMRADGKLLAELDKITDPEMKARVVAMSFIEWPEIFKRVWIAGGVDFAATYNAIAGFDPIGALIRDDWRQAHQLLLKHASRPKDKERHGFVVGVGGGMISYELLGSLKQRRGNMYGAALSTADKTDGDKFGKAREGYGPGQLKAMFETWEEVVPRLTVISDQFDSQQKVFAFISEKLSEALGHSVIFDGTKSISSFGLKLSQQKAFVDAVNRDATFRVKWSHIEKLAPREVNELTPEKSRALAKVSWNGLAGMDGFALNEFFLDSTRVLRKNVRIVFRHHLTSTVEGDKYENNSTKNLLYLILPEGQFAFEEATKAQMGHALGGSSGIDRAISPFTLRYHKVIGTPGLDNIEEAAAANDRMLSHKSPIDLSEITSEDDIIVVWSEAAGFNAKYSSVIDAEGKMAFDSEEEAIHYWDGALWDYMLERTQRRAEREGLRKMVAELGDAAENQVPISRYNDLYQFSLRTRAIADAVIRHGFKVDEDHILDWVYQFPLNPGVKDDITHDKENNPQAWLNEYNNLKYREANDLVSKIRSEMDDTKLAELGQMAREQGWDRRPVIFFGASDGMGLRTLLELIVSGSITEVVAIHKDQFVNNPESEAQKDSSFTPEILKRIAMEYGVNITVINTEDKKTYVNGGILFDAAKGEWVELQQPIIDAVEASISRIDERLLRELSGLVRENSAVRKPASDTALRDLRDIRGDAFIAVVNERYHLSLSWADVQDVTLEQFVTALRGGALFFDFVAWGMPLRRPGDEPMKVPGITAKGVIRPADVNVAKDDKHAYAATLATMGENHGYLLRAFRNRGWITPDSISLTADWWGSESETMLLGVYGGALLGDAKIIAKKDLKAFADELGISVDELLNIIFLEKLRQEIREEVSDVELSDTRPMAEILSPHQLSRISYHLMTLQRVIISSSQLARMSFQDLRRRLVGTHIFAGYPSFLSTALNAIPGGTPTGLLAKRIYEDMATGLSIEGVTDDGTIKFYGMTELALDALIKLAKGEFDETPYAPKVSVDKHEMAIAPEIDRRFQELDRRMQLAMAEKRKAYALDHPDADLASFDDELTDEESFAIAKDLFPEDFRDFVYQHLKDPVERARLLRLDYQQRHGIESLPLPQALQSSYGFIQGALGEGVSTPEFAVQVIDEGGVGALDAGTQLGSLVASQIAAVKSSFAQDVPLVVWLRQDLEKDPRADQLQAVIESHPAAVIAHAGLMSAEAARQLHEAGILVIQALDGSEDSSKVLGLHPDALVVVRNHAGGLLSPSMDDDADHLVKKMRQTYFDAMIPVIAAGGFNHAGEIEQARYWGASAIVLDDALGFGRVSPNLAKARLADVDPINPVVDVDLGKAGTLRLLNTPAARDLITKIARIMSVPGLDDRGRGALIQALIAKGTRAAAEGSAEGLYPASLGFAREHVDETISQVFERLLDTQSNGRSHGPSVSLGRNGQGSDLAEWVTDHHAFVPALAPALTLNGENGAAAYTGRYTFAESQQGFSGVVHGGMQDSFYESIFSGLQSQGVVGMDTSNTHRLVEYLKPLRIGQEISIKAVPSATGLVMELSDGATGELLGRGRYSSTPYRVAEHVEVALSSDQSWDCLGGCVAASGAHPAGLHYRHHYDARQKTVWGVLNTEGMADPIHAMMLAGDDVASWTGLMASRMWGYTSQNEYIPCGDIPVGETITLMAPKPVLTSSNIFIVDVLYVRANGDVIGKLRVKYYADLKRTIGALARSAADAASGNPEAVSTHAMLRAALGPSYARVQALTDVASQRGAAGRQQPQSAGGGASSSAGLEVYLEGDEDRSLSEATPPFMRRGGNAGFGSGLFRFPR